MYPLQKSLQQNFKLISCQNKSSKIYSEEKNVIVCHAFYFRLCIDLMHILPPGDPKAPITRGLPNGLIVMVDNGNNPSFNIFLFCKLPFLLILTFKSSTFSVEIKPKKESDSLFSIHISSKECLVQIHVSFNPFPHDKILGMTKLKEFADDELSVTKMTISVYDRVEKHAGKGEIACTSNFSFSQNVFKRLHS